LQGAVKLLEAAALRYYTRLCSPLFALVTLSIGCATVSFQASAQGVAIYKVPKLSIDQRVADLLSRMTPEEKLAQIDSAWENRAFLRDTQPFFVDEKGVFLPHVAKITPKNGLGQVSRPSENPGGNGGPREMAERCYHSFRLAGA
jgi:beta-glucosidase